MKKGGRREGWKEGEGREGGRGETRKDWPSAHKTVQTLSAQNVGFPQHSAPHEGTNKTDPERIQTPYCRFPFPFSLACLEGVLPSYMHTSQVTLLCAALLFDPCIISLLFFVQLLYRLSLKRLYQYGLCLGKEVVPSNCHPGACGHFEWSLSPPRVIDWFCSIYNIAKSTRFTLFKGLLKTTTLPAIL